MKASRRTTVREAVYGQQGLRLLPISRFQSGDPYFSNVSLLLQPTTETNGQTIFKDRSSNAHTLTRVGDAIWDTGVTLFGLPTILLDGTGDSISLPCSSSVFDMSTGDWTFEVWARLNGIPGVYAGLIDGRSAGSVENYSLALYNIGGTMRADVLYASGRLTGTTTSVPDTTMTFIQIVRESGVVKARIGGSQDTTTQSYSGAFSPTATTMYLGSSVDPYYLNGRIGAVRITKGVARANVVPTAPFPTS